MKKESCLETLEEAILAEKNGADRVELCSDLANDGLTPDNELIKNVLNQLNIPIRVMIRPRAGNFCYSIEEVEQMKRSILLCKEMKVEGVVFGILRENKSVDLENTKMLANLSFPLKVTFHKAIDETPDIEKAIEQLSQINTISSVLTSGGQPTAKEGSIVLKNLVNRFNSKLDIISAGKVKTSNIDEIHQLIGGSWYHGRMIVALL